MPSLVVVAGPNGSGKSTFTRSMAFPDTEIIDPDAIALETRIRTADRVEVAAAREALHRQRAAIASSRSFLIETTLAGKNTLRVMKAARRAGFSISLHYVSVSSPNESALRVRNRVARGGHDVPVEDIRRRFTRSRANLPLAMALSDEWHLYDNTDSRAPHLMVAVLNDEHRWIAAKCPEWATSAVTAEVTIRRDMAKSNERGVGQQF